MPGQQRPRGHHPMQPQVPRQQPGQGGQHGTVSPVRLRPRGLPAQDRGLMPQHEDLRILSGVIPGQEHQPAEHPDHQYVEETDKHERRALKQQFRLCAGFWHGTGRLRDGNGSPE